MSSVGQLLKEERLKKNFTLEQVEKATKIRAKFLTAIEADDYRGLPALPYIQGFIKNYSDFLGLRSFTLLALFRRQYSRREKLKNSAIEEPLVKSRWQLTPNKVIAVLVVVLVIAFFGYFYGQFRALHTPPPLNLESPKDDAVVSQEMVSVYGMTDSDATVTINNEPVLIKDGGKFFKDISLTVGNNTLVVESTNRAGAKTTVIRQVTRLPEPGNPN